MKHYKYSAILLAAMTCGAVWASVDALTDGKKGEGEKVKPSENFVAQSLRSPSSRSSICCSSSFGIVAYHCPAFFSSICLPACSKR